MVDETRELPSNPKDALAAFLIEIDESYYPWYDKSVKRLRRIWYGLHWLGMILGVSASAIASVVTEAEWEAAWVRILLFLFPLLATIISTVVVQSRLAQRFELRENGRRIIQALSVDGERRYAAASTDGDYTKIHEDIAKRVEQLEKEQGATFFAIVRTSN